MAVVALRIVLQHWISTSPIKVSSATLRSVAWLITPTKPCRRKDATTFIASFPGTRVVLEDAFSTEVRLNELLHASVQRMDLEAAKHAIIMGADVNSRTSQGWTSLHIAASKGHGALCHSLLQLTAEPGIRCKVPVWPKEEFTPLRIALRYVKARHQEAEYHRARIERHAAEGRRGLWHLRRSAPKPLEVEALRVLLAHPSEEDVSCGVVASATSLLQTFETCDLS